MKALFSSLAVLVVLTLVAAHFEIAGTYSEVIGVALESPSAWDVLTFAGGTFMALATFDVPGLPLLFSTTIWFLLLLVVGSIIYLIRGTN